MRNSLFYIDESTTSNVTSEKDAIFIICKYLQNIFIRAKLARPLQTLHF